MRQIHVFAVILALFVCCVYTAPYHINDPRDKDKPAEGIAELKKDISSKLNSFAILGKQKRETVTQKDPTNSNKDNEEVREELLEHMSEEFVGNPCATEPCKNYGKCKWRKDQTPHFVCICTTGYFGKVCEEEEPGAIPWDIKYTLFGFAGAVVIVPTFVLIHLCRINNRRNKIKKQFEDCLKNGQLPTSYPPGMLETSNQLCCMFWCCARGDQWEVKPTEPGIKPTNVKVPDKKSRDVTSENRPQIKHSSKRHRSFRERIPLDNLQRRRATVHYSPRKISSMISDGLSYEKNISRANVRLKNLRSCMAKGKKLKKKKVSLKDLDDLSHQKISSKTGVLVNNLRRSVAALQSKVYK